MPGMKRVIERTGVEKMGWTLGYRRFGEMEENPRCRFQKSRLGELICSWNRDYAMGDDEYILVRSVGGPW
jgi:hypothetical protein